MKAQPCSSFCFSLFSEDSGDFFFAGLRDFFGFFRFFFFRFSGSFSGFRDFSFSR